MQTEKLLLTLPLTPVPASRPRVTRWGTYYGKRYTQWREEAENLVEVLDQPLVGSPCHATVLFAIPRSKHST